MEKPLATTLVKGQKIQNTWQKVGTVGMIGFNFRFNPLYKAAGQGVLSGRIGSIFSTATQYSVIGEQFPQTRSLLLDLTFHHVDLIHYF